ncbi:hypothetical protein P167DRAFT_479969, partial [Morchella conica CCBAS932]
EIESWVEALNYYDAQEYEDALRIFEQNADTSKIYFNIGMIHATLGEHEKAVEAYQRATKLDQFLAVAYFQQGVSNFLLGEFTEAMANFNEALLYLRGNTLIDYEQLGLKFKLFSCEVLFNRGLCYIYDQQIELGMKDLEYAAKEKQVEDHSVIDDAIREQAERYTVFSVGVGVLYRPNEAKVRNVKAKDYLGKARLVAASDAQNAFTGFAGTEVKKQMNSENLATDDRAPTEISFAATNLVNPDLVTSRRKSDTAPSKEGSAASIRGADRQVFPPTPPPENEFSSSKPIRSNTVAGRRPPPGHLRGQSVEPRRAYSTRAPAPAQPATAQRSRTVRERGDRHQDEEGQTQYSEDIYTAYSHERDTPRRGGGGGSIRRGLTRRGTNSRQERFVDEDEYASDAYEGSSFDEDDFEMLDNRSIRSGASRRAPEVKKIKVKAHGEDTRMIMINVNIDFDEFVTRLQDKFGYRRKTRCKIRDEDGDGFISVSDQEDLDMAISSAKKNARRERSEFGKLEVCSRFFF